MFTGIVQGLGKVISIKKGARENRFFFLPQFPMPDITDGESIAINGVCLSVENHSGQTFSAYASRQTLEHSNLGLLDSGALVNLERAVAMGDRLGGHLVSGHVDCVATVEKISRADESLACRISFPENFSIYIINRGSVALNGISLTVTDNGPGFLEVNIIPDSQKRTNMPLWQQGSKINMETDLLGKYVLNFAQSWFTAEKPEKERKTGLSLEFLGRHGFL